MFCHFCLLNDKSEEFAKCFKISTWLSKFQYITSSFAQRYFTFDDPMRGNLGWKLARALTRGARSNISLCIGVSSTGLPIRIQNWLKRKKKVGVFSPVRPIQFLTPPVPALFEWRTTLQGLRNTYF